MIRLSINGRDVSDRLLSVGRIVAGVDRNDYEAGVATIGNCKMTVYNGDGYFDEGSGHPRPVFAEGREGARVALSLGNVDLFRGSITEGESRDQPTDARLEMTALSDNALLRKGVVIPTALRAGTTPAAAFVEMVRNIESVDGVVGDWDSAPGIRITNNQPLVGRSLWEGMISIAQATGRVFYVETGADDAAMLRVYPANGVLDQDDLVIEDPTKFEITSGVTRIKNAVEMTYGAADTTFIAQHAGSVERWGEHKFDLELPWIANEGDAKAVADAILVDDNVLPHRLGKVTAWLEAGELSSLRLLAPVRVFMREEYDETALSISTPIKRDESRAIPRIVKKAVDFTGRIIRYQLRPQDAGVLAEMTLEEFRPAVPRVPHEPPYVPDPWQELARWNDSGADYRTAGEADYTNFSGASWCGNRAPLNDVADPFPLEAGTTYRLRYVPGGSATQAAAQIIGTPQQTHIDAGIACYRFGTAAEMAAKFGAPVSNPHSPASFNGGTWILDNER